MNHSEIERSVIRAKKGHHEELLKIIEQYRPFIFKTAKEFNIRNYDLYDLSQIGYVALVNAVSKYNTGSNTFSSYAYTSIKNALKYTARQNSKFDDELSLNLPVDATGNITTEYIDCIESEENFEEDILKSESIMEVKRAVSKLPAEEMELIIMVYYSNCSLKTYAEKKGIGYLQAFRMKKRVLEKLRGYIM